MSRRDPKPDKWEGTNDCPISGCNIPPDMHCGKCGACHRTSQHQGR
jgi:hypothetical protein